MSSAVRRPKANRQFSRLSGHFGSLRNLASLASPSVSPHQRPDYDGAADTDRNPVDLTLDRLFISKFISPSDVLSSSPAAALPFEPSSPPVRSQLTTSVSRTQARLLLEAGSTYRLIYPTSLGSLHSCLRGLAPFTGLGSSLTAGPRPLLHSTLRLIECTPLVACKSGLRPLFEKPSVSIEVTIALGDIVIQCWRALVESCSSDVKSTSGVDRRARLKSRSSDVQ